MNNEDTLQYFADYPQQRVEAALKMLGYSVNDAEFPETILEDMEAVLDSVEIGVQKQLASAPETPQSEALVAQERAAIAAEILEVRNISVDPRVILAVAQASIAEAREQAAAINRLRREAFVGELRNGQMQFADDLLEVIADSNQTTSKLFAEGNLRKMVNRAVPEYKPKFNVDEFLNEVSSGARELADREHEVVRVGSEARAAKVDFDLDAFLDEVW